MFGDIYFSGISQQHPSACERLQRVSPLGVWQDPEAHQVNRQLAHKHRARAEEGDGKNREGANEKTNGKNCLVALNQSNNQAVREVDTVKHMSDYMTVARVKWGSSV